MTTAKSPMAIVRILLGFLPDPLPLPLPVPRNPPPAIPDPDLGEFGGSGGEVPSGFIIESYRSIKTLYTLTLVIWEREI